MAAQCGVPLLVTPRIRQAYDYLTDDSTSKTVFWPTQSCARY